MLGRHGLITAGILLSGCGGKSSLEFGAGAGGGHAGLADSPGAGGEHACDGDGDGHRQPACGGDDCDDRDRSVHPGAPDTNAEPGAWNTEEVFGNIPNDSRGKTSIAVDSAGGVHVTEGTEGLRYATNERGGWVSEVIDPGAVGTPSLVLVAAGVVNIAYNTASEVRLAIRGKSGWSLEPILALNPGAEPRNGACALAAGVDGRLHLVYAASGTVEYATQTDGIWTVEASFGSSSDALPALALDAAGAPHIAFGGYDGGEALIYATRCDLGFCTDKIAPGPVMSADLAVDAAGVVHFVYGFLSVGSELTYGARRSDGAWVEETLAAAPSWSLDLELDEQGSAASLHLAIIGSNNVVTYARREPNGWVEEPAPSFGTGLSLALQGDRVVHLGFTSFRFDVNTYVGHTTNRALAPDGIDQNCDGIDGVDGDGDGHAAIQTGGTDCDDRDPSVHPLAVETPNDQLDSDCDGTDG